MTRKSGNELWLATTDFDLLKKNCGFIFKQMEQQHHHKRKHLGTTTFRWTSFIATKQRGISYLHTSCVVHHFSIHNGYFTRHHLMPSWSNLPYQGPRCKGYHGWAALWLKNKHSMESSVSALPTISSHKVMEHMAYSQWYQHLVFHND